MYEQSRCFFFFNVLNIVLTYVALIVHWARKKCFEIIFEIKKLRRISRQTFRDFFHHTNLVSIGREPRRTPAPALRCRSATAAVTAGRLWAESELALTENLSVNCVWMTWCWSLSIRPLRGCRMELPSLLFFCVIVYQKYSLELVTKITIFTPYQLISFFFSRPRYFLFFLLSIALRR